MNALCTFNLAVVEHYSLQEFQIEMKSTSTVKCFHIHLLVQSVDSLANVVIPILQRRKLRLGENV